MKKTFVSAVILLAFCVVAVSGLPAYAKGIREQKTLGVFFNYDIPRGDMSDAFDSDFAGGIKLGYGITESVGAEFAFSRFTFDGKSGVGDASIDCFRGNILYRFDTTTNLYPFFTFGAGYYMPEDSSAGSGDNKPGINFGLGIITNLIDINDMFALDFSGNYHHIFNDGEDTTFFELRLGLNFNFF